MKCSLRAVRPVLVLAIALSCVAPVLAQSRKVNQANLYNYWILLNRSVSLDAPNSGHNLMTPGCAAVTYVIGSDWERAVQQRMRSRDGIVRGSDRFFCAHCGVPVYLIVDKTRQKMHFRHHLEDGRCPAVSSGELNGTT